MKIRLGIVEDNTFLLKAIKEKLSFFDEIEIKWTALNGQSCLDRLTEDYNIDIILMDVEMPVLNGIETTRLVKAKHPQLKVIILTVFDNDEHIFNAIKAGADGYLLKEIAPDLLFQGIKETLKDGAAMSPSIALKTLKLLRNPLLKNVDHNIDDVLLTKREIEVLGQLSKGLSYTKIADNLFLAPSTIRKHIENIYRKLQVHNKLEAVEKAKQNNLL